MSDNLIKNILLTVVYYDVLDYPLTSFEIWKYLTQISRKEEREKFELFEVVRALEDPRLKKHISESRGFHFLAGREGLVESRLENDKISREKVRIIKRITRSLRFVPFVRMVAIAGKVAQKNAKRSSDLDFFIVIEEGRIFTGRFLVTLWVHLLGRRRYGRKISDRACLNYYVTTSSLEIDLKDIYSSNEYSFLFPLFGRKVFRRFQRENSWIADFKPDFSPDSVLNLGMVPEFLEAEWAQKFLEKIFSFGFWEKNLKRWQMRRIMGDPRTYQKGSAVMAGDDSLVFLPDPHGPKIYEKFRKKLDEMKVS